MFKEMVKYIRNTSVLICLIISLVSCGKGVEPTESNIYFSTSFEKESDLENYFGNGAFERREDALPGSGKYSLFVSGGCLIPHCAYELPPLEFTGKFILRLQGKALINMGGITLSDNSHSANAISIFVDTPEWNTYESLDTLLCSAGSSLVLDFMAGGFVQGAMLVDDVKIIKTD